MPYHRHLVSQFSTAYDIYLRILHEVDGRVKCVLTHDTANWRMLNICPPCTYKLDDEPNLGFSMLAMIDGNQSLKSVDTMFRSGNPREDNRATPADMWISPEEVDRFKDEVQNRGKVRTLFFGLFPLVNVILCQSMTSENHEPGNEDFSWINVPDELKDPDSPASVAICVERWKNAGPESHKKMFALFAATGIFVCVCRHGHVLTICDMIRSGEAYVYVMLAPDKLAC